MKKAYVKPVFLAEEFGMTACVASCVGASVNSPIEIEDDGRLCVGPGNDHRIDADSVYGWENAAGDGTSVYLFTNSNIECDYLWYGEGSSVQAWSTDKDDINSIVWNQEARKNLTQSTNYSFGKILMNFFCGNNTGNQNHRPGYNGYAFFS